MGATSLRRARDFVRVQSTGRRARSDGIAVAAATADDVTAPSRLGLAVGRGAGGAVVRNRVKRRLRAAWGRAAIPPGYDVVMRASRAAAEMDFQDLVDHVKSAVTRATTAEGRR